MNYFKPTQRRYPFESLFVSIAICLVLLIGASIYWFKCRIEATTFNKLTGANVTAWDAMWVQLRVDIPVKLKGE